MFSFIVNIDLCLSLHHLLLRFHRYCGTTFTLIKISYTISFPYHHFIEIKFSMFNAYHVPIALSFHISLGYPISLFKHKSLLTLGGFSYCEILLNPLNATHVAPTFLLVNYIDLYIQIFVRYFLYHVSYSP